MNLGSGCKQAFGKVWKIHSAREWYCLWLCCSPAVTYTLEELCPSLPNSKFFLGNIEIRPHHLTHSLESLSFPLPDPCLGTHLRFSRTSAYLKSAANDFNSRYSCPHYLNISLPLVLYHVSPWQGQHLSTAPQQTPM